MCFQFPLNNTYEFVLLCFRNIHPAHGPKTATNILFEIPLIFETICLCFYNITKEWVWSLSFLLEMFMISFAGQHPIKQRQRWKTRSLSEERTVECSVHVAPIFCQRTCGVWTTSGHLGAKAARRRDPKGSRKESSKGAQSSSTISKRLMWWHCYSTKHFPTRELETQLYFCGFKNKNI